MKKFKSTTGYQCILTLIASLFMLTSAQAAVSEIKHSPEKSTTAGQRLIVKASIEDESGIDVARVYFKGEKEVDYNFVEMIQMSSSGKSFSSTLPAPDNQTNSIDYVILVKNSKDEVYKSQVFQVKVKNSNAKSVVGNDQIQVYTELAQAPQSVPGFTDNIVLDIVDSAAKYGVVAGLTSSSSAGVGASAVSASSTGTVAATSAGLGMGGVALGAVAVGAAAGGGSGGGDDGGPSISGENDDATTTTNGVFTAALNEICNDGVGGSFPFSDTLTVTVTGDNGTASLPDHLTEIPVTVVGNSFSGSLSQSGCTYNISGQISENTVSGTWDEQCPSLPCTGSF